MVLIFTSGLQELNDTRCVYATDHIVQCKEICVYDCMSKTQNNIWKYGYLIRRSSTDSCVDHLGHTLSNSLSDIDYIKHQYCVLCIRVNILSHRFCKCSDEMQCHLFKSYCLYVYASLTTVVKLHSESNAFSMTLL